MCSSYWHFWVFHPTGPTLFCSARRRKVPARLKASRDVDGRLLAEPAFF